MLEPIEGALERLAVAADHEVWVGVPKLVRGELGPVAADDVRVRGEVPLSGICRHVLDCRFILNPVETAGIEPASAIA